MRSSAPKLRHRKTVVIGGGVLLAVAAAVAFLLLRHDGVAETRLLVDSAVPAGVSSGISVDTVGGLRLCNKTTSRIGIAIGYKERRRWTTEGWWNVDADSCETLMAGPLVSRYYYVYALDYDQGGIWGGKAAMCTRDKMFTIHGIEDCVARGFERSGFFEVDTGEQRSWTVQLTEPGTTGTGGR